jgi:hypothetical protein
LTPTRQRFPELVSFCARTNGPLTLLMRSVPTPMPLAFSYLIYEQYLADLGNELVRIHIATLWLPASGCQASVCVREFQGNGMSSLNHHASAKGCRHMGVEKKKKKTRITYIQTILRKELLSLSQTKRSSRFITGSSAKPPRKG